MLQIRETVSVGVMAKRREVLHKWRSSDPEVRGFDKLLDEKLEIVSLKRNVGIQAANQIECQGFDALVTGIETVGLSRKVAIPVLGHPK
jgi:hypothetical protein